MVAAAKAMARPAHSVVFEDATVGIQAAKAAGMYAVGLTTTHPAATLADPAPMKCLKSSPVTTSIVWSRGFGRAAWCEVKSQ